MAEAVPSFHVVRCKFRAHHDGVVVKDVMEYLGELLIYLSGFHVARLKPRIETLARCQFCPAFSLDLSDPEYAGQMTMIRIVPVLCIADLSAR